MSDVQKHFWFSAKQQELLRDMSMSIPYQPLVALIDGKTVIATMCSVTLNHQSHWDDLVYLGQGEFAMTAEQWRAVRRNWQTLAA